MEGAASRAEREVRDAFGPSGAAVRLARAPYRVSPLGAHTDHQEGLTCGFALDRALELAFRPVPGQHLRLRSCDFAGDVAFSLDAVPGPAGDWGDYVRGVARELVLRHAIRRGIEGVVRGELPPGGISSSAALQVAVLLALLEANEIPLDRQAAMETVVAAERAYAGVHVGLLDPAVILFARARSLVFLDCREGVPRVHRLARSARTFAVLLLHAGDGRDLRESLYNQRIEECRLAARQAGAPGDAYVLRDVDPERFRRMRAAIDPVAARRAEHVFAENKRVRIAQAALASGDVAALGRLMDASAGSLTRLYDCGTRESRLLLELLAGREEVLGASYAGAGFGGMVQALVWPEDADVLLARVLVGLEERDPALASRARAVVCGMGEGARVL